MAPPSDLLPRVPGLAARDHGPSAPSAPSSASSGSSYSGSTPSSAGLGPLMWATVAVVVLGAGLCALVGYFVLDRRRGREYRRALERDPYLTRREFSRRCKMTALDRVREEEMQRSIIIHKSLASRATSRSDLGSDAAWPSSGDVGSAAPPVPPLPLPSDCGSPVSDGWKEWEAGGVRRGRSDSSGKNSASDTLSLCGSLDSAEPPDYSVTRQPEREREQQQQQQQQHGVFGPAPSRAHPRLPREGGIQVPQLPGLPRFSKLYS